MSADAAFEEGNPSVMTDSISDSSSSTSVVGAPDLERRRHRKKQRIERKRRDRANHFRRRDR